MRYDLLFIFQVIFYTISVILILLLCRHDELLFWKNKIKKTHNITDEEKTVDRFGLWFFRLIIIYTIIFLLIPMYLDIPHFINKDYNSVTGVIENKINIVGEPKVLVNNVKIKVYNSYFVNENIYEIYYLPNTKLIVDAVKK